MIKLKDLLKEIEEPYRNDHTAPDPEVSAPLYDLTLNGIYPKDYYETMSQYRTGEVHDAESMSKISACHNKPRARVMVYRAVPKEVKTINQGDWVALARSYAKEHGEGNLRKGTWKILKTMIRAKDLWNNGDSINEWGYVINPDPKVGERKFYTKDEMIKLGADGYLDRAKLTKIPVDKIDGREPIPEPNSYKPGREIKQPIEVEYDPSTDKYMLYSGNHRVRQAEVNGQKWIPAFVQIGR